MGTSEGGSSVCRAMVISVTSDACDHVGRVHEYYTLLISTKEDPPVHIPRPRCDEDVDFPLALTDYSWSHMVEVSKLAHRTDRIVADVFMNR